MALRLGLVGCGRLAELGYLPAIAMLPEIELAAVADPSPERARRVATLARDGAPVRVHAGARELVAAGGIEAVVIASPPSAHQLDAEAAAAAGVPSLVEKPPAESATAAGRLATLDPAPRIGFNRRFQHGRALLPRLPRTGRVELDLEIHYRRASWRPHTDPPDAWLDLGPHLVDLALLLAGDDSVEVRRSRLGVERAEVDLETARGPARIRCATDRPYRERIVVGTPRAAGRRGRILARSIGGGLARGVGSRLARRPHPLVASLRDQLAAFAGVVRGADEGLLASASEGVRVMRVVDAARGHAR